MKITDWKKKFVATLAAFGVAIPVAHAADLRTNLVANPGFEDVNPSETGPFTSIRILDWFDPVLAEDGEGNLDADDDFAYPYASGYSGNPAPPGGGDFHFTGGFNTAPGDIQVTQSINLASGASAAAIAAGDARFDLSGYFSSYRGQSEFSEVRITFLDQGGSVLANDAIGGDVVAQAPIVNGQRAWYQDLGTGIVPLGTAEATIDILSIGGAVNYDAYVDNIDFRIGGLPDDFGLQLQVDPASGLAQFVNHGSDALQFEFYQITSAGSLSPTGWQSLDDQSLDGNSWLEAGGSSSVILGEATLTGAHSLGAEQVTRLGRLFVPGSPQDLTLQFGTSDGLLRHGNVVYVPVTGGVLGDLNGDGAIDAADAGMLFSTWGRSGIGDLDASGITDAADAGILFTNWTGDPITAAVPEPSLGTFALVGLAIGAYAGRGTQRRRRSRVQ